MFLTNNFQHSIVLCLFADKIHVGRLNIQTHKELKNMIGDINIGIINKYTAACSESSLYEVYPFFFIFNKFAKVNLNKIIKILKRRIERNGFNK